MRLYIDSSELPCASIIDRDGVPHVSVEGAEAGTWKASGNHAQARKWGLEYLAAAQAMEAWQATEAVAAEKLQKRRDELVSDIVGHGWKYGPNVTSGIRPAVDRIIELEGK